jgi:aryl-alcohol dehydrogenase-like predicted oxidoreductase
LQLTRITSIQPRYSLLFREIERELMPLAKEEGMAVIPFNPLAGGMQSGKCRPEQPPAGRFAENNGFCGQLYRERYWYKRQFDTIQELSAIAHELNVSLPTLAVAWVLANPVITAGILGASRVDQLADTLAAADVALDSHVKTKLDALTQEYRQGDAES